MKKGETGYPSLTQYEMGEFKKLTQEVYGDKLTNAEAYDQGARLIMLFELILKKNK